MIWVGHVECIGEIRNAYKILVKNLKGSDPLEDLGIDGRPKLKLILKK
jgi:hypothetical protein